MNDDFKKQLHSFPSPFVRAMSNSSYDKGRSTFTVTGLLSPPQRTWLGVNNERIETPYGSFSALLGTAVHSILEANVDLAAGERAEERMFAEMHGVTVSGQMDLWENGTLFDYKTTRGVQDAMKPDHHKQANMNAYLAKLNGVESDYIGVVYIQMDWSYMQSTVNPSYPQSPFRIFLEPYDEKLAKETFDKAIPDHIAALDGKPRECTRDEKWQRDDTYALMKPGAKRASKVCDSRAEAEAEKKPSQIIQERPGERVFCSMFCGYSHVCPQFKRESMEIANANSDF